MHFYIRKRQAGLNYLLQSHPSPWSPNNLDLVYSNINVTMADDWDPKETKFIENIRSENLIYLNERLLDSRS